MPASAPVSVLIPCYCCADTIGRAVASAIEQTLPPAEILFVEDASPDAGKTLTALQNLERLYAGRVPLRVIPMTLNVGPAAARNAGWEAVTQPYVAFLDADDAWHPKKLELQVGWMEAHPEVALTGTRSIVLETMDQLPPLPAELEARELSRLELLVANRLPTRSVVLRADLPDRFVPEKRYSEDYLLWASILLSGRRVVLLEAPLAFSFKRDFGAGGLSSHLWSMHREVLDTHRRLQSMGHISAQLRFALDGLERLKFVRRVAITGLSWLVRRGLNVPRQRGPVL